MRRTWYQNHKRFLGAILWLTALTIISFFLQKYAPQLLTSVLPVPPHQPFDGTVYPIQEIPDWVRLTEAERKFAYSELPKEKLIPIPPYEPSKLRLLLASLTWGNPVDDSVRNAKITYSVPYLGNYKLDGIEGGGSHPGIDIKAPLGTPMYAIANGSVVKAGQGSGGSGNMVILQHNDVPSFDDPTKKVRLYSAYLHLSEVLVTPLSTVSKGQLIGKIGQTGIATTPHLHFQIDTDDAPYHPFWPFTWKEAQTASLSFFEAINSGLGKENALLKTVNPLAYVARYRSYVVAAEPATPGVTPTPEPPAEPPAESPPQPPPPPPPPVPVEPPFPDVPSTHPFVQAIRFLKTNEKIRGYDDGTFQPEKTVSRVEALKILLGSLDVALKADRKLAFKDVAQGTWYSPYLVTAFDLGIVNGYPDRTFRVAHPVTRAEFMKMLILTLGWNVNPTVNEPPYPDVLPIVWFSPFVSMAKEANFLSFIEGDFFPAQPLTRGEVAELVYRAMATKQAGTRRFDEANAPRR